MILQNKKVSIKKIVLLYITLCLTVVQVFAQSNKIRVIHTTDLGMDLQDDGNTLVRALLFSNNQNIIGLTPSGGPWQDQLDHEYERILHVIDLYEDVYDNLKLHDPAYPTPDYL